jgi:hypothetical protein
MLASARRNVGWRPRGAKNTSWIYVSGTMTLCLLSASLQWHDHRSASSISSEAPHLPHLVTRWTPGMRGTAAEEALLDARHWRLKAMVVVNQERDAMESWDPHSTDGVNQEMFRRQLMAQDRGGYLHEAHRRAYRALALAQNPSDTYRILEALACIECECGHHPAELKLARRLVGMSTADPMARMVLHRAERCNALPVTSP